MKKNAKPVKDAKYLHKSPPVELNTGFSILERYVVVNEYRDGSYSDAYNCDIVSRRSIDGVGIIPYAYIEGELNVLLISNFRAVALFREKILGKKELKDIDEYTLSMVEVPAGILEESELKLKKIEDGVKRCASRELLEETGYRIEPKHINMLGSFYYSSPGIITERIFVTTCDITGKKPEEPKTDGSVMEENIKPFFLPLKDAMKWCEEGVIRNALAEIAVNRLYFLMMSSQEKMHANILQKRINIMSNEIRSLKKESSYYNKLIREFKATITHELKHPFTEVMGYLSILKNKNISDEQKQQAIDIISRSIKKLYDINSNLIKVAVKDEDTANQSIQEFDVYNDINEIIENYRELYASKLETNIKIDEACKMLIGHRDRFKIIMEGLVSNAFKFTKSGSITISVRLVDAIEAKSIDMSPDLFNYHLMNNIIPKEVDVLVQDTGIGIKPRQLNKIFIPFYQADSRFSREFAGVGIGLSIVKDLVEIMQGTINVQSSIGFGTTINMRIPFGIAEKNS